MKNRLIPLFLLLFFTILHSQVGINTQRPIGAFHVDAAGNNSETTDPTEDEQKDDFVISKEGVVSIGTTSPSPYSSLEIESDKGLRLPQLTNAERDALDALSSSSAITKKNGLTIYNVTTKCINYWANTEWAEVCGVPTVNNCIPVSGIPSISPSSPNLVVGESTMFTVSGVTNATSYDWYVNGTLLTNTTSPTSSYTPTSSDYVSITVIAKGCNNSETNESNAITGNPYTEVNGTPVLTADSNLVVNNTTIFTVSGVTNATSYDWFVNGSLLTNTTSPTLSYTLTTSDYVSITVIAKGYNNSETSQSNAIIGNQCIQVSGTPVIGYDTEIVVNTTTILTVSGVTNATSYKWYVDGTLLTTTTLPTYSYTPATSDYMSITVIARGCNNSETSESNPVIANSCTSVTGTPVLTADSNLVVNNTSILTVTGVNNATSYDWFVNGTLLTNTTSPTLSYTLTTSNYVSIKVVAKGCNNSETSQSNAIIGNPCIQVSGTPVLTADSNLVVGESTIFTVSGVTNATSYKWYLNRDLLTTTTLPTYSYTPTAPDYMSITVIARGCNSSETDHSNAIIGNLCAEVSGTPVLTAYSNLVVNKPTLLGVTGVTNATSYDWFVNGDLLTTTTSYTYSYTPTSSDYVSITVIAKSCNNSETNESNAITGYPCTEVNGTPVLTADSNLVVNNTSILTVSGVTNATSYDWFVNGDLLTNTTSPTLSYIPATSDYVSIKVIAKGCNNSETSESNAITGYHCTEVNGTPVLTADSNLVVNRTTIFTVSGVTNATSYDWFVNGILLTNTTSPTLSYIPATSNYVSIKVIAKGCNNSETNESNAITGNPCIEVLGTPVLSVDDPNNVVVNNTSILTARHVSYATSYDWYVDGTLLTSTTLPTLSYTPATSDYMSITVIARGCNNSETSESNAIIANPCTSVTGTLTISSNQMHVGYVTYFQALGVNHATRYDWYINDILVQSSYGGYFNYTPTSADLVTVSVIAFGCNGTQSNTAYYSGNPCIEISGTPTITTDSNLVVGEPTIFTVNGIDNPFEYEWFINDVIAQIGASDTFSYTPEYNELVTISVIGVGCWGNITPTGYYSEIPTFPCPIISEELSIYPANSSANAGTTVTFTASRVNDVDNYIWSINGVQVQSGSSNTYDFFVNTTQATNTITVVATNSCGNTKEATTNLDSYYFICDGDVVTKHLIPSTECEWYILCHPDGYPRYYSCTRDHDGGSFNPDTQECTTEPFTCPY